MFESNYFPFKQYVTIQLFPLPCAVRKFRISLPRAMLLLIQNSKTVKI